MDAILIKATKRAATNRVMHTASKKLMLLPFFRPMMAKEAITIAPVAMDLAINPGMKIRLRNCATTAATAQVHGLLKNLMVTSFFGLRENVGG
jgi:hypothetical protein